MPCGSTGLEDSHGDHACVVAISLMLCSSNLDPPHSHIKLTPILLYGLTKGEAQYFCIIVQIDTLLHIDAFVAL